jgi:hypothetical protein
VEKLTKRSSRKTEKNQEEGRRSFETKKRGEDGGDGCG